MARSGISAIVIGIEESADEVFATDDAFGFNLPTRGADVEHASSEKDFRQFMIGVASHGRSALLTQTALTGKAADHTAPYLSTIADAILTVDTVEPSHILESPRGNCLAEL